MDVLWSIEAFVCKLAISVISRIEFFENNCVCSCFERLMIMHGSYVRAAKVLMTETGVVFCSFILPFQNYYPN